MSASSDWVAGLLQALKQQFPLGGFTVREMKGKVFLQKRWPDGTRQAAALPIAWGPGVTLEVLATVKAVNEHLQAGASLKDAVHLQWPQDDPATAGRKKVGINWTEVVERFRVYKIQSGQVVIGGYAVGEGQHTGAQQINPIDIHRQMAELQSQLDSQQTRTSLAAESPGHELDAKPPAEPQQRRSHSFVSMFSGKQ